MNEKFLGYVVDEIPTSDPSKANNAIIKVVARRKPDSGKLEKLSNEEQIKYCPPNGSVFCPQFFADFNADFNTANLIEFSIKPGQEKGEKGYNHCDYIIEYATPKPKGINLPKLVHYEGRVTKILRNGYLSPTELSATINTENIFQNLPAIFFLYDGSEQKAIGIFRYDEKKNKIESNYGKNVQEFSILASSVISASNSQQYALMQDNNNDLDRGSIIDFMSDEQLAEWFRDKCKNITQIDKKILSRICNFPEFQGLEDDVDIARFERVKAKVDAININAQTIVDLMVYHKEYCKQLAENMEEIKEKVKDEIRREYIESASDTINANKKTLETQKQELHETKEKLYKITDEYKKKSEDAELKLKKETEKLQLQIDDRQKQLQYLNENYNSVLATITAALPIINKNIVQKDIEDYLEKQEKFTVASFPAEGLTFKKLHEETEESFKSFAKRHVCINDEIIEKYLFSLKNILSCKACFIPCVSWAYIFAKAIRNTEVYTIYIEHDWLHYADFCKNGLLQPFQEAEKNPTKIYFLVLDGINLTQPECGLRPLLNLINGTAPVLQGFNLRYPQNVKIFATVLPASGDNPVGLKLSRKYFANWNAFGNPASPDYMVNLPVDFDVATITENAGYLEPDDLVCENVTPQNKEDLEVYFAY